MSKLTPIFQKLNCILFLTFFAPLLAQGEIRFHDIANEPDKGLEYSRAATPELIENRKQLFNIGQVPLDGGMGLFPARWAGSPGVAIFDYDSDGDLDIYVTNGPDRANSLFKNLLSETGKIGFVDVAESAGVAAISQDSTGVCFGDIDNDGDQDLFVLGRNEANRLFQNQGKGNFKEITTTAGVVGKHKGSASCSMGDINGNGLLDIIVSNSFDWETMAAVSNEPFIFNQHNELYQNQGDNRFIDISSTSGIELLKFPSDSGAPPGTAGITWSIAFVDIDLDGDVDLVVTDDQGNISTASLGGEDRGYIRIWKNDGTGFFHEVTEELDLFHTGGWMSLAFADFDCNGNLDIFATNLGDYLVPFTNAPYVVGSESSKWLLQQTNGIFSDPGLGNLKATPFGWGSAVFDYDNDGDTDIVFHGGVDLGTFIDASNPGAILKNHQCNAQFAYASNAASGTDHSRRSVLGLAIGDLNNNGFPDIVTVSNFDIADQTPVVLAPDAGSAFDESAFYVPIWMPAFEQGIFVATEPKSIFQLTEGSLSVELNSADNSNNWIKLSLMGSVGITTNGQANRDGIGAVISFTPKNGKAVMYPVLSGGSSGSQHSLDLTVGLGVEEKGTIDVLWPGGTRNRFADLSANQTLVIPEIPCSTDANWKNLGKYVYCINTALKELRSAGTLDFKASQVLKHSAIRAFQDHPRH